MLSTFFKRAASLSNSNNFKLTSAAAEQIKSLLKGDPTSKYMRIGLAEGGCAGFSYRFDFENELRKGDHVFKKDDAEVVLDDHAFLYLRGATLDFTSDNFSSTFRIDLPKSSGLNSCSCGKSVGNGNGTCGGH